MIAMRRALVFLLGMLSVAVLAQHSFQWTFSPQAQRVLESYDNLIVGLIGFTSPLFDATLSKISTVFGARSLIYPHWPHVFLVLALQFLPRSEFLPGIDRSLQAGAKFVLTPVGLTIAAFVTAILCSYASWTENADALFILFALVSTIFFQNIFIDWLTSIPPLSDKDLMPAFENPGPIDVDETGWSFSTVLVGIILVIFLCSVLAILTGTMSELFVVHAILGAGILACLIVGFVLWAGIETTLLPIHDLLRTVSGRSDDVTQRPLLIAARVSLLLLSGPLFAAWFFSELPHPGSNFLLEIALVIASLACTAAFQHLTFKLFLQQHEAYAPSPSTLGVFIFGAALLLGVDSAIQSISASL